MSFNVHNAFYQLCSVFLRYVGVRVNHYEAFFAWYDCDGALGVCRHSSSLGNLHHDFGVLSVFIHLLLLVFVTACPCLSCIVMMHGVGTAFWIISTGLDCCGTTIRSEGNILVTNLSINVVLNSIGTFRPVKTTNHTRTRTSLSFKSSSLTPSTSTVCLFVAVGPGFGRGLIITSHFANSSALVKRLDPANVLSTPTVILLTATPTFKDTF